ncbi:MAG TPA: metallophosphoesterase [Bryobacteraceae bacterium]|nr:metallophosphoesterase [Bryobacteraceae bacterium]
MPLHQFRSVKASMWQSALDEVTVQQSGGGAASLTAKKIVTTRPMDQDIATNNSVAQAIHDSEFGDQALPAVAPPSGAAGIQDTAKFCANTAFRLAEARVKAFFSKNDAEYKLLQQQLSAQFGQCDPKWGQVIEAYVRNCIASQKIPYRPYNNIGDYVLTDRIPQKNATIALLADWGTGEAGAKFMLQRIAARNPDVVLHLGDVYYSGTDHEFQNYFYSIWQPTFNLPKLNWNTKATAPTKPATFTLAGNHDMYAGGAPYYTTIDMLGQPASYFCLRNDDWQFIALDTGYNDSNPTKEGTPTFLQDSELVWLKDKIATAGGRRTVLLSHHQLFTGFKEEAIGGDPVNQKLYGQVKDILSNVDIWFWGHEHNLTIFKPYLGVLARCIGHAAFPIPTSQPCTRNDVPVELTLTPNQSEAFFPHGYLMMNLDGRKAHVTYIQYDFATDQESVLREEDIPELQPQVSTAKGE